MKILILITAFNVGKFITQVIKRIPQSLYNNDVEILIIDDCSSDNTLQKIIEIKKNHRNINIKILSNIINLGYGGNQKIGYYYAIKNNFDFVVLLHGDGQYAPEKLENILEPLFKGKDAVQGSRMINKFDALRGNMPIYKFFGNIFLTKIQNFLTGMNLSEYHSGYRAYSVKSLKKIPFDLNSKYYHFDTQILIQLNLAGCQIEEVPIPTFYGKEISYLNSIKYGFAILITSIVSFLNRYRIFYDRKYDSINNVPIKTYKSKMSFESSHLNVFNEIKNNSKVLDIGCDNAYMSIELKNKKNCYVAGINKEDNKNAKKLDDFKICDLNNQNIPYKINKFDYLIMSDIIEHLSDPELFMNNLYNSIKKIDTILIITTPNIANIFIRIMLLFGRFNYGKSGILDKTHTRLFTLHSIKKLLQESNFYIIKDQGIPAPFPLIINNEFISNLLININKLFINISKKLFSFQFMLVCKINPSLDYLLNHDEIDNKKNDE